MMTKSAFKLFISRITGIILCWIVFYSSSLAQSASSNYLHVQIGAASDVLSEKIEQVGEKEEINSGYIDELAQNIPKNRTTYSNRYALIIGNENYARHGMGPVDVEYAANDARVFREYAVSVLGVPESNILFRLNITTGVMNGLIERQYLILKNAPGNPELVFYYSGHGYPCGETGESGLLPVDADPQLAGGPISLRVILEKFAAADGATVMAITDACFTGEGRGGPVLLAQRGVKYVPVKNSIPPNTILFAASQSDQPALPWVAKRHGLFTYCLLDEIKKGKATVNWGTVFEKVESRVAYESVKQGYREQRPSVKAGMQRTYKWRQIIVKK
jgi:hypothetical protein